MRKYFWFSLLTLVALLTCASALRSLNHSYAIPFQTTRISASTWRISQLQQVPLPAGLQAGDVLDGRLQSATTRAWLVTSNPLPDHILELVVERDGKRFTVPVHSVPQAQFSSNLGRVLFVLVMLSELLLGLLTLWRGRDWTAWGLSLFTFAILIGDSFSFIPAAPWPGFILGLQQTLLDGAVGFSGFYLMANALTGSSLQPGLRQGIHLVYALVLSAYAVLDLGRYAAMVFTGDSLLSGDWLLLTRLPIVLMVLIPLLILMLGYGRVDAARRPRVRWLLWSTALIVPIVGINQMVSYLSDPALTAALQQVKIVIIILLFASYTYAVLRQRLVDVRVAVNRTLVYGVLIALVVGIFAALSAFVERAALGRNANLFLELVIPLLLGIAIHTLRTRVEGWINRFVFRRKYRAEAALGDFARTCGFIENLAQLLDQAVDNAQRHTGAEGVALYECAATDCMRVRAAGRREFPARMHNDDPAAVQLRAGDAEVDLHKVHSSLGGDGYAFPLMVHNNLLGLLVCGPRPAEQYTADERRLLQQLARQVAAAWQTLRMRDKARLVDALASGALEPQEAREQARKLFMNGQIA
ncbi:MAG: GAF domain-containing protein [Gammaproteobacteria bacterium]|nr:GAF domain-containing protein [Gammaproteobacteria bacterium]